LGEDEQALLRHLAVFPAGLTFPQVRKILAHLTDDPSGASGRLVRSSLVSWSDDAERRLVMIDAVRDLCEEESARRGEGEQLWRVAVTHARGITHRAPDSRDEVWLEHIDTEYDNLVAVLDHLLPDAADEAMELTARLSWYWYLRGHYEEGARWLEASIAHSRAVEGPLLTRALHGAGRLALLRCRYQHADGLLARARDLAHHAGDVRGEAEAVQLLGSVARERGEYGAAEDLHRRGLELWLALGDEREAARARNYITFASWIGSRTGDASRYDDWWRDRGERELRRLDDLEGIVWALLNRSAILHYADEDEEARTTLSRAFEESVTIHFSEGIAWSLNLIGLGSLRRAEHVQARAQLAASLRVHRNVGDLWRCASVLEALAAVSMASERPAQAGVYIGVAEVIRGQIAAPVPACERGLLDIVIQAGRDQLGMGFDTAIERGRRTELDQAIELAAQVS
jgi:non-specific serine/threonine protein kinase